MSIVVREFQSEFFPHVDTGKAGKSFKESSKICKGNLRENRHAVAGIEGKAQPDRLLLSTHVFIFQGRDRLQQTSFPGAVLSVLK